MRGRAGHEGAGRGGRGARSGGSVAIVGPLATRGEVREHGARSRGEPVRVGRRGRGRRRRARGARRTTSRRGRRRRGGCYRPRPPGETNHEIVARAPDASSDDARAGDRRERESASRRGRPRAPSRRGDRSARAGGTRGAAKTARGEARGDDANWTRSTIFLLDCAKTVPSTPRRGLLARIRSAARARPEVRRRRSRARGAHLNRAPRALLLKDLVVAAYPRLPRVRSSHRPARRPAPLPPPRIVRAA